MTGTVLYVGQRTLLIAFTALAVSSIVFIGIHRLPGNAFVSERLRPSQQAALLHQYGRDRPRLPRPGPCTATLLRPATPGVPVPSRATKTTPRVLREATVSAEVGAAAL